MRTTKVTTVESIIPHPWVRPWRHPVWWWKFRFLRRDAERLAPGVDRRMLAALHRHEEAVFMLGADYNRDQREDW